MQRHVGRRKCKEINLLAYEFSGRDAEEWGLANRASIRDKSPEFWKDQRK